MFEVRVVCEGPTDVEVIRAILDVHLRDDYVITQLQPDGSLYGGDAGPYGVDGKGSGAGAKRLPRPAASKQ